MQEKGRGGYTPAMELGNDPTLVRYEWSRGRCTCLLCFSNCNKLFHMEDFPKIALAPLQANRRQQLEPNPAVELSEMLGRSVYAGMLAMTDSASARSNQREGVQAATGTFYDAASGAMLRMGGNMSSSSIQHTQRVFGRQTDVTLPGAASFDTNHITRNTHSHARNNRMGGGTALANTTGHVQGMTDRLCPDSNNPSAQFQAATCNPNHFVSSISGLAESMLTHPNSPSSVNTTQ